MTKQRVEEFNLTEETYGWGNYIARGRAKPGHQDQERRRTTNGATKVPKNGIRVRAPAPRIVLLYGAPGVEANFALKVEMRTCSEDGRDHTA